ncbi:hypothetical protein TPA0598_07_06630 [Streptomyces lydicamycinicus]|uniref:Uncharacterized protein n=1 Tax=Streptomyces lydicamycinicus TaxID=1546107 RepID=A0A0N7YM89_9ACTN|nr:hypothetical protein TPA0598_07_06630 [Streptomyces lydicamycinicus]
MGNLLPPPLVSHHVFGPWSDIDEFTSRIENIIGGYPTGDPWATIELCIGQLETDVDSDATVYWVLGVAAVGPWMEWCDERPDLVRRAEKALEGAVAVLRRHEDSCTHDAHPWDGGPFVVPDDLTTFMYEIQEADEWEPDPEYPDDEAPYGADFGTRMRCPRNVAAFARNPSALSGMAPDLD